MKKILLSDLRAISAQRPAGYYDEIVKSGRIETAEIVVLEDEVYAELRKKYRPQAQQNPPQAIPSKDWPVWAKALAWTAKPEDKGIGDVVARMIGPENSEAFKRWYKATTGKNCGCNGRQNLWNIKYPINSKAT